MELALAPKTKRAKGEVCCEPLVLPDVDAARAADLAVLAKALSDPIRVQLVDVLRNNAGKVCVCELVPLFDVSQPTISHHLKVLHEVGLLERAKRGVWVYYSVKPNVLADLAALLGGAAS